MLLRSGSKEALAEFDTLKRSDKFDFDQLTFGTPAFLQNPSDSPALSYLQSPKSAWKVEHLR